MSKDFPLLSDQKRGLIISNDRLDDGDYAKVRGRTLYINNNAFRNRNALEKDYAENVQKGLFPAGTAVEGIAHYESGHLVRSIYKLSTRNLTDEINLEAISEYATVSRSEGIVEGFNAYYGKTGIAEALTIVQRSLTMISNRR